MEPVYRITLAAAVRDLRGTYVKYQVNQTQKVLIWLPTVCEIKRFIYHTHVYLSVGISYFICGCALCPLKCFNKGLTQLLEGYLVLTAAK